MNQAINEKVKSKISEDLSPTKNFTGLHLKIVAAIAIIWSLFQLWYASPFPFWFNIGMFKGLPARAIHLGYFGMHHHFLSGLILECLKGFQQELFI